MRITSVQCRHRRRGLSLPPLSRQCCQSSPRATRCHHCFIASPAVIPRHHAHHQRRHPHPRSAILPGRAVGSAALSPPFPSSRGSGAISISISCGGGSSSPAISGNGREILSIWPFRGGGGDRALADQRADGGPAAAAPGIHTVSGDPEQLPG